MQPPPRKGNYAKFLKNLHSEQIAKLVTKNQHECDLLEDIRTFTIKRCAIERSYSEALLKISSAYLNKKIPNIPDIKLDGGEEKWNMWNVWRTVLEENEKLARARLAAVEIFQQQIADDSKMLRTHKVAMTKRCVDHLAIVQKELQTCVQDVDKTKKLYFDEEHSAHDVRDKARDLEEKLKKKKGSFFQSITSLQKNSAKFTNKREQLEEKSSGARNDYLLCLAAANAHQNRYFVVDLQLAMSTMESSVFDKVAEYLSLMGRTELLTCSAMQNSFSVIRDQAKQLTREYNLQCCYLYYPVLKQHIQYEFEPCDADPVEHISAEHESAAATLSKEARRWAGKIARENNNVRDSVRRLQIYNALRESGQKTDPNDQNGPDLETKIDEMKQSIRRSETSKMKAEARIEYLRIGGVNVDEWLQEAETLNVQDIQRSASSLSDHPSSDSFYDSDFADGEAPTFATTPSVVVGAPSDAKAETDVVDDDDDDSQDMDAILEQERSRIEAMAAEWDDPTAVDWGHEDLAGTADIAGGSERAPSGPVLKCTALYSYTAQNPDELSIVENEQLEVVGEGDGDGWLRARNYRGEEGYVPHNYLDVERDTMTPSGSTTGSAGGGGLANQISFSSVDYTIDNEDGLHMSDANQSPDQVSVIAAPSAAIQPQPQPQPQPQQQPEKEEVPAEETTPVEEEEAEVRKVSVTSSTAASVGHRTSGSIVSGGGGVTVQEYCIALYDYDGEGEEELTFDEGQVIRIVSKVAHSVDDGWWQGEVDGRIGNFPSLVVEVCDEFGEPLSGGSDDEPPASAPPVFTPPQAPEGMMLLDGQMDGGGGGGGVFFVDEDDDIVLSPPAALNDNDLDDYNDFDEDDEDEPDCPGPPPPTAAPPPPVITNGSTRGGCKPTHPPPKPPPPPPPPPPAAPTVTGGGGGRGGGKKQHRSAGGGFNMELSRGQQEQYGQQFSDAEDEEGEEEEEDDAEGEGESGEPVWGKCAAPVIPTIGIPCVIIDDENARDVDDNEEELDEFGLGVAQIVITAATPMIEEPEQPFPPPEGEEDGQEDNPADAKVTTAQTAEEEEEAEANSELERIKVARTISNDELEEQPADSAPFPVSSSSEGETTGPSTAENSVSHQPPAQTSAVAAAPAPQPPDAQGDCSPPGVGGMDEEPPKQVVGGRASIPDELEPHQLARLQDLKESNA